MERFETRNGPHSGSTCTLGGSGRRPILIVEDDPDILDMAREFLEQQGYAVATAGNGEEALGKLQEIGRPCLILLDLFMPVMNGLDFLRALRSDDDHVVADLPVVIVSAAEGTVADQARGMANGFLRKPVAMESFLTIVARFCGPA